MDDVVPVNGVQQGPRSARWNPLEPATILYADALDKGDIRMPAERVDAGQDVGDLQAQVVEIEALAVVT